jgi:hypothetical protein
MTGVGGRPVSVFGPLRPPRPHVVAYSLPIPPRFPVDVGKVSVDASGHVGPPCPLLNPGGLFVRLVHCCGIRVPTARG